MGDTLITAGIACVIAAIVGGGLKAFSLEVPVLSSRRRQIALAVLGLVLIALGMRSRTPNPSTPPAAAPAVELDAAWVDARTPTLILNRQVQVRPREVWEGLGWADLVIDTAGPEPIVLSHVEQGGRAEFSYRGRSYWVYLLQAESDSYPSSVQLTIVEKLPPTAR